MIASLYSWMLALTLSPMTRHIYYWNNHHCFQLFNGSGWTEIPFQMPLVWFILNLISQSLSILHISTCSAWTNRNEIAHYIRRPWEKHKIEGLSWHETLRTKNRIKETCNSQLSNDYQVYVHQHTIAWRYKNPHCTIFLWSLHHSKSDVPTKFTYLLGSVKSSEKRQIWGQVRVACNGK